MSQAVADLIRSLRRAYVEINTPPSYYEINNGLCEDFALDLIEILGGCTASVFDVEGGNFMMGKGGESDQSDIWDWELLMTNWNIGPPEGFTTQQIDGISFGNHIWITADKRHFDAECPDGVDSFFDLPLFRRYLVANLRKRGISSPDVQTDDIVPAPLCSVPNPL